MKALFDSIPLWFFPSISIAINAGSCLVAFYRGDVSRTVYWACAALLTTSITFHLGAFPWAK